MKTTELALIERFLAVDKEYIAKGHPRAMKKSSPKGLVDTTSATVSQRG